MKRNVAALLVVLLLLCSCALCAKAEGERTAVEETNCITGIAVTQTTDDGVYVEVGYTTSNYAELVIALYDGTENRVMLASGAQKLRDGQGTCEIFAAWKGEAYSSFKVVAYLLDTNDWKLLCPSAYILQGDVPQTDAADEAGADSGAAQDALAAIAYAPYENAYLIAYTLAQLSEESGYITDPFAGENLYYIAQLSGEELKTKTFSMQTPMGASLLAVRCDFTDVPVLLQKAEEGDEGSEETPPEENPEESEQTPSAIDVDPAEELEEDPAGSDTGGTASVDVSQSVSGAAASGGTQALWMAAASAGIFATAAVAKKVFFAQGKNQDGEQTIRLDLQLGRWIMQVSNNAATQPAQQGQQSSASAAEEEAAANE
jgi:hypothetical protein